MKGCVERAGGPNCTCPETAAPQVASPSTAHSRPACPPHTCVTLLLMLAAEAEMRTRSGRCSHWAASSARDSGMVAV